MRSFSQHSVSTKGFTLIEVIITITVLGILGAIAFGSYRSTLQSQQIEQDAAKIVSVYEEARSLSISGRQGSSYGVHASATKVTRFQGQNYVAGSTSNVDELLSPYVTISAITLTGGTSDVIFSKISGTTTASGTITLALIASTTVTKTITIYGTGLVEITK